MREIELLMSDPSYGKKQSSFAVSKRELFGLQLFSKVLAENLTLEPAEKVMLQTFIKECLGNMDLNKKIVNVERVDSAKTGVRIAATSFAKDLTFRTRHLGSFDEICTKAYRSFQRLNQGLEPLKEDGLSLSEYAVLRDMSVLQKKFDQFHKAGLLDPDLEVLYEKINKAASVVEFMEQEFKKDFKALPGTIVFDNYEKQAQIKGMSMGLFDKLTNNVVSKYSHVSKVLTAADNTIKTSHINPGYAEQANAFSLREYLYSDAYVIRLDKLISEDNKKLLQKHYGENWQEKINSTYQDIERQLHDKARGRYVGNVTASSSGGQVKAGFLSTLPFGLGHRLGGSDKIDPHEEMHQKVMGEKAWREGDEKKTAKMLCSEFIATTTVAALVELDRRLSESLGGDKGKRNNIITIPINTNEYMPGMHPQRFLDVLISKGVVDKVPTPRIVPQFFANQSSMAKMFQSLDVTQEQVQKAKNTEQEGQVVQQRHKTEIANDKQPDVKKDVIIEPIDPHQSSSPVFRR